MRSSRRHGYWSREPIQDLPHELPAHGHFRHLEDDLPGVPNHPCPDLDKVELDRLERPVPHLRRQREAPHEVEQIVGQHPELEPDRVRLEPVA